MNEYGESLIAVHLIDSLSHPLGGIQAIYQRTDGASAHTSLGQVVHWKTHGVQDPASYGPDGSPVESMRSVARLLLAELIRSHGQRSGTAIP